MILKKVSRRFLLNLVGLASLAILAVGGCSKDESDSVTNPGAKAWQPEGTIQGVVRDAVTLQPIVGALVSIDVRSATTDEQGSYVIKDVPATTDALNGTVSGAYTMEIDTSNAYTQDELGEVDLDMRDEDATPRYPRITYSAVAVSFTSLNDSECSDSADAIGDAIDSEGADASFECGNSTNHDTPVDGLVANANINIGKLACNIRGVVYGCEDTAEFADTQDGYEVRLTGVTFSGNSATGNPGNILGQVTTDASGGYEFVNIECGGQVYSVTAANDFDNPTSDDTLIVTGPVGDGATLVMDIEHDTNVTIPKTSALHVCINDDLGPQIIAVIPEPGSDLAPNSAGETVTITFHEPIAQSAATDVTVSGVGNLYEDIDVQYDGQKAGNIPHTIAWNSIFTQLTITFSTGTSGLYRVTLPDVGSLTDEAGNGASPGVCPNDSSSPWSNTEGAGGEDDCVVFFSTTGGLAPDAPSVTLVNAASLDEGGSQVGSYDWLTTAGAKDYEMFCRKIQVWEDGTVQTHAYESAAAGVSVSGSSATVDFDELEGGEGDGIAFVENSEIALHYECYVVGISSDGVAGPASNIVEAEDNIGPEVVEEGGFGDQWFCGAGSTSGGLPDGIGGICDDPANPTDVNKLIVGFNENLREGTAETTANYTFQGLATGGTAAVSTAAGDQPVYNPATNMVLLTLSDTLDPTEIASPVVRTGANGLLETVSFDTTITAGANAGLTSTLATRGLCVYGSGGADTIPATGTDDVVSGANITVGPDGICQTEANNSPSGGVGGFDVQVVEVGQRSGVCATENTGGADITESGDDVDEDTGGAGTFTAGDDILSGVNGICDTLATDVTTAAGVLRVAQGNGTPNSAGIVPGGDVELDTTILNNEGTCATVTCDDAFSGSSLVVDNVLDVNGNTNRDAASTPTGNNVYRADGTVGSQ